jgi:hypothetical protein
MRDSHIFVAGIESAHIKSKLAEQGINVSIGKAISTLIYMNISTLIYMNKKIDLVSIIQGIGRMSLL